jgi:F0F1-type ATP synthase epsilon subunit
MADKSLYLKIITPNDCIGPFECDSVKLIITDGKRDKEGGSYGIRRGHVTSLLALGKGKTEAFLNSKLVFSAETSEGFAKISPDLVTLVVDSVKHLN